MWKVSYFSERKLLQLLRPENTFIFKVEVRSGLVPPARHGRTSANFKHEARYTAREYSNYFETRRTYTETPVAASFLCTRSWGIQRPLWGKQTNVASVKRMSGSVPLNSHRGWEELIKMDPKMLIPYIKFVQSLCSRIELLVLRIYWSAKSRRRSCVSNRPQPIQKR